MKQFRRPRVLLINPWIHDFAAFNLWSRPLGLLEIGGALRDAGFLVSYIDCVDAENFSVREPFRPKLTRYGTGKLKRTPIDKPRILASVPRRFCRYGITPEDFHVRLESLPPPDLILVTSIMTYWYPGVRETIEILRRHYPQTPIWLGGIYATLLPGHARAACRPDRVIEGPFTPNLLRDIQTLLGTPPPATNQEMAGLAFWEGYESHHFLCLRTSTGCPFRCPYCASHLLFPEFSEKPIERLVNDAIRLHRRYGILDFAFFDDALLLNAPSRLVPFLKAILKKDIGLRFHTPNGIHIRFITKEIAELMKASGFRTLRLSLETVDPEIQRRLGAKATLKEFDQALSHLFRAGFTAEEVKVYLLVGLPGQTFREVESSVDAVLARGVRPSLAEYSPIPGTALWQAAREASAFPLSEEPLTHNNVLLPCGGTEITKERLDGLKRRILEVKPSYVPEYGAVESELFSQEKPDENHP